MARDGSIFPRFALQNIPSLAGLVLKPVQGEGTHGDIEMKMGEGTFQKMKWKQEEKWNEKKKKIRRQKREGREKKNGKKMG